MPAPHAFASGTHTFKSKRRSCHCYFRGPPAIPWLLKEARNPGPRGTKQVRLVEVEGESANSRHRAAGPPGKAPMTEVETVRATGGRGAATQELFGAH